MAELFDLSDAEWDATLRLNLTAVWVCSRTAARHMRHGGRVNCVMPGAVPTEIMMTALHLTDEDLPNLERRLRLPMRRLGTLDDLGAAVLYFVSPASSWVTGQILAVDGGM